MYKSLDPATRVVILKALCDIRVEVLLLVYVDLLSNSRLIVLVFMNNLCICRCSYFVLYFCFCWLFVNVLPLIMNFHYVCSFVLLYNCWHFTVSIIKLWCDANDWLEKNIVLTLIVSIGYVNFYSKRISGATLTTLSKLVFTCHFFAKIALGVIHMELIFGLWQRKKI